MLLRVRLLWCFQSLSVLRRIFNFLFSGLGPMDYERVSHLKTAREIWSLLSAHHEGTATIKARLFTGANMRISSRSRESQ